jgi:hypothetical protein
MITTRRRGLTLALVLLLLTPSGAAAQSPPPWREGPIRDVSIAGYDRQRCGRALEKVFATRARNGGFPFSTGTDARITVNGPVVGAKTLRRDMDFVVRDVDAHFLVETTTAEELANKYRTGQVAKDVALVGRGGTWNGQAFRPKTVVYFMADMPPQARDLARQGIGVVNYLTGDTNFADLPPNRRPSAQAQAALFRPIEYPPVKLPGGVSLDVASKGLAFLNAAVVVLGIYQEIKLGLQYADRAQETQDKLGVAIEEVQRRHPQATTFWARVALGGDKVGPFADAIPQGCGIPTLTTAHVTDLGAAPCRAGEHREVPGPFMGPVGQQFITYDVCLVGLAAAVTSPPSPPPSPVSPCQNAYENGVRLGRQGIFPPRPEAMTLQSTALNEGCLPAFNQGLSDGGRR